MNDNLDIDRERAEYEHNEMNVSSFDVQIMKETALPNIENALNFLVWSVVNGEQNALEVFAVVKTIEKLFTDAKKKIDEFALTESERYNQSTFEAFGQKFELRNGGTTFDYKGIKEWEEAKKNLSDIEEKYKQAFISYEKGLLNVTLDGEELTLPKVSYRKSSLIVKNK